MLFAEVRVLFQVWTCIVWKRWKSARLIAGDDELLPMTHFSFPLLQQLPELSMLFVYMFFYVQNQWNESTFVQCLSTCVHVFPDALFCKRLFCNNVHLPYFQVSVSRVCWSFDMAYLCRESVLKVLLISVIKQGCRAIIEVDCFVFLFLALCCVLFCLCILMHELAHVWWIKTVPVSWIHHMKMILVKNLISWFVKTKSYSECQY